MDVGVPLAIKYQKINTFPRLINLTYLQVTATITFRLNHFLELSNYFSKHRRTREHSLFIGKDTR